MEEKNNNKRNEPDDKKKKRLVARTNNVLINEKYNKRKFFPFNFLGAFTFLFPPIVIFIIVALTESPIYPSLYEYSHTFVRKYLFGVLECSKFVALLRKCVQLVLRSSQSYSIFTISSNVQHIHKQ